MDNWASPTSKLLTPFLPPTNPSYTKLSGFIYETQSRLCLVTFIKHFKIKLQDAIPVPPHLPSATVMFEAPITVQFTVHWMLHTLPQLRDLLKLFWVNFSSPILFPMSNQSFPMYYNISSNFKPFSGSKGNYSLSPLGSLDFCFSYHLTQGTINDLLPRRSTHYCEHGSPYNWNSSLRVQMGMW